MKWWWYSFVHACRMHRYLYVHGEDVRSAVDILTEVHTRDDAEIGFYIQMGATPDFRCQADNYIQAWYTLREFLGKPVVGPRSSYESHGSPGGGR